MESFAAARAYADWVFEHQSGRIVRSKRLHLRHDMVVPLNDVVYPHTVHVQTGKPVRRPLRAVTSMSGTGIPNRGGRYLPGGGRVSVRIEHDRADRCPVSGFSRPSLRSLFLRIRSSEYGDT